MEKTVEEELITFIAEKFKVSSHKIPHYLRWIRKYIELTGKTSFSDNTQDKFLKEIYSQYPAWQVEQADKAVTIYISFIRKNHDSNMKSLKLDNSVWKNVILNMKEEKRLQNKSLKTERSYIYWVKKFSEYSGSKIPGYVSQDDVKGFLTYLAVEHSVAVSTQKQAFNAILFLFRHILDKQIDNLDSVVRSKVKRRLPLVLSQREVSEIIRRMKHSYRLMTEIIYGCGLRLSKCLSLRIKDVDFQNTILTIRSGKGDKDRQTLLSTKVLPTLKKQIQDIRKYYEEDRFEDRPGVELPRALERKFPNAGKEWTWFWVFPSARISVDPRSGIARRHYMLTSSLQKSFKTAIGVSGIAKNKSIHTLAYSFAIHLVESGYDIRTIQELLGHSNVSTIMIYTHISRCNKLGVISPMDQLDF
ncbi:MAG: integron integrase [Planctomycetes bacterium]|nr:integron integrase [Planctomycetota bacterium]